MADNKSNDPNAPGYDPGKGSPDPKQPGETPQPGYPQQPPGYWQPPGYPPGPEQPPAYPPPPGYPPPPAYPQPPEYPKPPDYPPPPTQYPKPPDYPPPPPEYPKPPDYPPPPPEYPKPPDYPPPPPEYPKPPDYPPPPPEYPKPPDYPPQQPCGQQPPGYAPPGPTPPGYAPPGPTPPGYAPPGPTPPGYAPPGQQPPGYAPPGQPPGGQPPTGYQPGPPLPDPDKRLKDLEGQQKKDEAEIEKLKKQTEARKKEIEGLKGAGTQLEEILEAYEKARPNLENEKKEDSAYADAKMVMIECAIGPNKGAINQIIAKYDEDIKTAAKTLEEKKTAKTEAEKNVDNATKAQVEAEKRFNFWKNFQKETIEKNLTRIEDLKKLIEKEDDLNHPAAMYVLTIEVKDILGKTEIVSKKVLKEKLYTTLDQLGIAEKALRDAQAALVDATTNLDAAQKEVDDLTAKRRENLLKKVSVFDEAGPEKKSQAAK